MRIVPNSGTDRVIDSLTPWLQTGARIDGDGTRVPVEVKGSSASGPFVITSNELLAAKERPGYVLYHVVDLTTPAKTRMRVFRNLGTRLTDDVVTAAGWAVTGWQVLEPDEIQVNPQ
jgi:hypothetical protein